MNTYMSGSLIRSSAAYTDTSGTPADPSSVVLQYKADAGDTTTVTYPDSPIVKDGTGAYHADLDTSGWAGPARQLWIVEWTGTGTVQAIGVDSWEVEPAAL